MSRTGPQRMVGTVTFMSSRGCDASHDRGAKPLCSHEKGRLARRMHRVRLAVQSMAAAALVPLSLASCVVPPSLNSEDADGGVNHPPVIRTVRDNAGQVLDRPGPLTFVAGTGELNITAADTDLGDTLYVRMYIDYGLVDFTPFRVQCEAAPGDVPAIERIVTCPLLGLCTDGLIDGTQHVFELDVLDRAPITTAERPFRGVTQPGEIASFWWRLACVAPS